MFNVKNLPLAVIFGLVLLLVYWAIGGGHAMKMNHTMDAPNGMATAAPPADAEVPGGNSMAGHDHSSHGTAASHAAAEAAAAGGGAASAAGGHAHASVDVSGLDARPDLEIAVLRDSKSGWNLHITTTNFKFTPASVGANDVPGEGHAHVYVNGVKLARVYSHWYHLPALPKGAHHIEVTLNSNSHGVYALGDRPVSRKITVVER